MNSLNAVLTRACPVEDDDNDELDEELEILKKENPDASEKDYVEKQAEAKAFKKLFEGKKVFISREVPREPFVFMIRCLFFSSYIILPACFIYELCRCYFFYTVYHCTSFYT